MKQTSHRVFRVADIKPNPFRATARYSLREDKVEALRASISKTTFWDNIVARMRKGRPEIAYGHHRLEALHRELGNDAHVRLIVRKLDDETMLQIMVQENMQEWEASATIEQESVRAVVLAYAARKINLPRPDPKVAHAKLRFAPSFTLGGDAPNMHLDHRRRRYTSATVAAFLGWQGEKVRVVLQALELVELGLVEPSTFDELGPSQARALVEGVRKVAEEHVCDLPDSWQRGDAPRTVEFDRVVLRPHVEGVVAALRAGEVKVGGLEQALNPYASWKGKIKLPHPVRIRPGKRQGQKRSAGRRLGGDDLLELVKSPGERYATAVARFLEATEALRQSACTKKPTLKERRRVRELLAQVRQVVDTLAQTIGK